MLKRILLSAIITIILIILVVLTYIGINKCHEYFGFKIEPSFVPIASLTLMILAIFVALVCTQKQIDETKTIENEKRLIAIHSLIEELKLNKMVTASYIKHDLDGNNVSNKDMFSWEWDSPQFGAYEKYLGLACRNDMETSKALISLYFRLQTCKTIVGYIHHLMANNIIYKETVINGANLLGIEVRRFNKQLSNISNEINGSFDILVKKLEEKVDYKTG